MIDLTKETPLGVEAAAELMGVSRRTIENWFKCGLDRTRLGKLVYTSREALQRFAVSPDRPQSAQSLAEQEADRRADEAEAEMARRWGI